MTYYIFMALSAMVLAAIGIFSIMYVISIIAMDILDKDKNEDEE